MFICAAWKKLIVGPTEARRTLVSRCDLDEGHEGHHADSVLGVTWRDEDCDVECRPRNELIPKTQFFTRGQRVRVDNSRYHGEGIGQYDDAEHKRMVRVLLGNGNTWPYEFETVTLVDPGQWTYERERLVPVVG